MSAPTPGSLKHDEGALKDTRIAAPVSPAEKRPMTTMAGTETRSKLADEQKKQAAAVSPKTYKGFVAGVFSGVTKLAVGHPFDTVKVRLQTSAKSHFSGPLDCVRQTIQKEGVRGLYKGATPPLVGWMFMDSLMLGSLTFYRRFLLEYVWLSPYLRAPDASGYPRQGQPPAAPPSLPPVGHGIAGILAGCTVSFVAAPVEHVKARLQIQYAAAKRERLYSGPLDCVRKIYRHHGVRGLYHGLGGTLLFRSFFFFWWSTYELFTRAFKKHTSLSAPAINFWAGGLSAQIFWLTSYPSDMVKQRVMTDPLGGGLGDGKRKYARWTDAARDVYRKDGYRGYWRGFLPCFLRAFPANAMALVAFEGVMRSLP